MRIRSFGGLLVAVGLTVFSLACGNSTTSPTTATAISVPASTVAVGQTSQLTAMAILAASGAGTQDITSQATWKSDDNSIATVSASGVVTGVAQGATTVTATYQGMTGSGQVTVTP